MKPEKQQKQQAAYLVLGGAAGALALWAWLRSRAKPVSTLALLQPSELELAEQAARERESQAVQAIIETEPTHVSFDISVVGDNIVLPASPYARGIHQLEFYNTVAQTIRFLDGARDLQGPLVNFPQQSGLNLRWQDQPHFLISPGQPFTVNLSAGRATGFVKFRRME